MTHDATHHRRYLTDRDLSDRYGIGRATVWRWVRTGDLPAPIRIGPGTTRWDLAEVEEYERRRREPQS